MEPTGWNLFLLHVFICCGNILTRISGGKLKKIGFCAKGKNNEINCKGDSGGAAIWKDPRDQNRAYVLGLASSFVKCDGIHPGIFTAISGEVAVWIHEKIKSTIKCQEQFMSW